MKLFVTICLIALPMIGGEVRKLHIDMEGQTAGKNDEHLCAWQRLDEFQVYITKLEPHVDELVLHHLATFGYTEEQMKTNPLSIHDNCLGLQMRGFRIFNWSHGSGSFTMPQDTGIVAGQNSTNINYIVIQAHYRTPFTSWFFVLKLNVNWKCCC